MTSPRQFDCLVAGDLFQDLILTGFPQWPKPGEESFAEALAREIGGGAAITACGMAKLGSKVAVLGAVGRDDSQWLVQRFEQLEVFTGLLVADGSESTALTVSVSGPSDRAYFTHMGANRLLPGILARAAEGSAFEAARHLHIACAPEPAIFEKLCRSARKQGCTVSADAGWHPEWLTTRQAIEALQSVDWFFPNEREAAAISQEEDPAKMLTKLAGMGLSNVVLKLGSRGAAARAGCETFFQAALTVNVADTTGAGDCFDAGFLHAWLGGSDLRTCLNTGVICGSLSTRKLGGIAGFPAREELDKILCNAKSA